MSLQDPRINKSNSLTMSNLKRNGIGPRKISRKMFYELGGFSNTSLYRKSSNGGKSYSYWMQ